MKNRKIKILSLLLALVMMSSVFYGCTGNKEQPPQATPAAQSAANTQAGEAAKAPDSITLPIVKQPITLKYFINLDSKMGATLKNYNEMTCYKEMEKRTGIHIEFLHPPVGQENEQFNLMLASNDLPDLIEWNWLNIPGGPMKAVNDGAIASLNDLIDKNAPNLKKLMNSDAQLKKEMVTDENVIYSFPYLYLDRVSKHSPNQNPAFQTFGWQIRKDWVEKLGLQIPETMDQWYAVLKAFKEKDPNGNGKNDEIPLVAQNIGDLSNWTRAWGINYGFYKDGDKVKFGPYDPLYKEYLTTMIKWYSEGLIDPDYAATDGKQFDSKVTGHLGGAWTGATSGRLGRYAQLMKQKDPSVKLTGTVPPYITGGKPYKFDVDAYRKFTGSGTAISSKSKYKKEATIWNDYKYSPEGILLMNYGVEGVSFKMVNGVPQLMDEITKNSKGLSVDQALGQHAMSAGMTSTVMEPDLWHQRMWMPEQQEAISRWKVGSMDRMMPQITPTAEESSRLAAIMNEVNTYKDEMFNKFIMGQEPISNYDKYINNLKNLGIEEAIKIQQAALDRFNKRK